MSSTDEFTIVVDTREQTPWVFETPAVRRTLKTGDYSVLSLEALIAIERKSLGDLVQSLTWERERFVREVERLAEFRWRAIIVEAHMGDVTHGRYRTRATPQSLIASTLAISAEQPRITAGKRPEFNDLRVSDNPESVNSVCWGRTNSALVPMGCYKSQGKGL